MKVQQIIHLQQISCATDSCATDYAYAMLWMCIVWYPVIADVLVQCVRVELLKCSAWHTVKWECDVG